MITTKTYQNQNILHNTLYQWNENCPPQPLPMSAVEVAIDVASYQMALGPLERGSWVNFLVVPLHNVGHYLGGLKHALSLTTIYQLEMLQFRVTQMHLDELESQLLAEPAQPVSQSPCIQSFQSEYNMFSGASLPLCPAIFPKTPPAPAATSAGSKPQRVGCGPPFSPGCCARMVIQKILAWVFNANDVWWLGWIVKMTRCCNVQPINSVKLQIEVENLHDQPGIFMSSKGFLSFAQRGVPFFSPVLPYGALVGFQLGFLRHGLIGLVTPSCWWLHNGQNWEPDVPVSSSFVVSTTFFQRSS